MTRLDHILHILILHILKAREDQNKGKRKEVKMKKNLILGILALAIVFMTTPAGAYPIIGDVDVITNYASLPNSGAAEDAWLAGLGFVEVDEYLGSALTWNQVSGTIWAAELNDSPDYYFIKIGTGGTSILYDHFMYQNNESKNWLVIDMASWYVGTTVPDPFPNNINVQRVSHVGEGEGTSVPEPATMLLLGLGLVGLAGVRRKFHK
jgi:hypothetical protein